MLTVILLKQKTLIPISLWVSLYSVGSHTPLFDNYFQFKIKWRIIIRVNIWDEALLLFCYDASKGYM